MDKIKKKRVSVFFDVSVDGDPYERMIFELFADVAPKTAENFRALCTGEKGTSVTTGKPLHYKGTFFHRIIKGYVVQGGDLLRQDGKYGESIYAGNFPDESAKLKHDGPGLLSMAIADRDERGSIFSITLKADHHLDRKNIVFGKLIDGHDVLKKIEDSGDGDGRPTVTVKIINCGELHEDKRGNKSKIGKDASEDNSDELKNKGKHRKSYRKRRKRRRRYSSSSSSDSDSVTDSDIDSSESNTDTDSDESSLSESSSSEDDRRKKKRRSKKERHRRKRRKDRRHGKRRKRRDKKSKRKSRRNSSSDSESDSKSENDDEGVGALNGNGAPLVVAQENAENNQGKGEAAKSSEQQVVHEFPQENGEYHRGNEIGVGIESDRSGNKHLDVVSYDHPNKFSPHRTPSPSPRRALSKSMSISPRNDDGSPVEGPKNVSRSASPSRSPARASERSRSRSRSLKGRGVSRSPPLRSRPQQTRGRSASISPTRKRVGRSPPKRSISRSPVRSSRRSLSRSPVKRSRRSISRSPLRSSRRSASRSLDRNPAKRSPSESPGRASRRVRRGSYSRSPRRSPPSDRGRNSSRSPSEDGSPKRIRRGRGFSDRYSYVRRYRSRSPDRSPIRSYRYGRADRYSSYRRSPRRYRSPARGRTPPRYSRGRRSRSRSPSRSPIRYRSRQRRSWSPVDRYHRGGDGEKQQKRRTASGSSRSRSPSRSSASRKSGENEKGKTRSSPSSSSSSDSPPDDDKGKGLVSYGEDGSPSPV